MNERRDLSCRALELKATPVREGFEPSEPLSELGALAKLCFQPLSHLTSKEKEHYLGLPRNVKR